MKTNKFLVLTLAATLVAGGLTAASIRAADGSGRRGAYGGRFLDRAKEKLGLTDDQVAQIRAVLQSDKENLTALATRLHGARMDLRGAIRSTNSSEAAVRTASAKVAAVEADFAVERMKLYVRISPILTDDQKAKLAEFQQRMDDFADSMINRASESLAN